MRLEARVSSSSVEQKSMTGRSSPPLSIRLLRGAVMAAERVSRSTVAHAVAWLMFRTRRSVPPPREADWLANGERWELSSGVGRLVAFRFGRGPVVILVHGWNGRGAQLGGFITPLVKAGFGVVTFDAPGHGLSDGSAASVVGFADAFDRVVSALREQGEEVHAVVAHSLGAAAVTFSENRRVRGQSSAALRRLVFVAPPIDIEDWVKEFASTLGISEATEHAVRGLIQARVGYRISDLYAPDLARELSAPLLVLHDEQDVSVPIRAGEALASAWPNARLVRSSGLGHTRILRDAPTIERAVAFIREEAVSF